MGKVDCVMQGWCVRGGVSEKGGMRSESKAGARPAGGGLPFTSKEWGFLSMMGSH